MRFRGKSRKLGASNGKRVRQNVSTQDGAPAHNGGRLLYLLSRYPAISHTFFLQEVRGLRELGFDIETASINAPDRAKERLSAVEAEEAATTLYLKTMPRMQVLTQLLAVAFTAPAMVWRALQSALRLKQSSLQHRFYSLFYVAEALLLCHRIRRRQIAHMHIHFGGAVATVGLIAAEAARIPYSLTIHGPDEFFDEEQFHLQRKIEGAAFVIAISHYCRSQLMRIASPAVWDRFDVVRLGIRPELLPPSSPSETAATVRLIMVGRLVPAKGALLLLQAVEQVRNRGVAVSLTFVGDGPERRELEGFIQQHDMTEIVTMTGALNHEQTLDKVAHADIFVLASFAEGIPVALMEAMALGVPCISTYIAGIPELIDHEQDGILVPAGSAEDLTYAILRLAADPALRCRFAEAARLHVLRDYHLPENLKQLAATFRHRMVSSKPS